MIPSTKIVTLLFSLLVVFSISGCVEMKGNKSGEKITFAKAGEFTDRRGQAKIKLYTYSGEAELEDVKSYAGNLGCGMLYVYFYPAATLREEMPIDELQSAKSFSHAQEILFQGGGYTKWDFGASCIGFIPTVTDCRETPLSTNCR